MAASVIAMCDAFALPGHAKKSPTSKISLYAKNSSSKAKGFGKAEEPAPARSKPSSSQPSTSESQQPADAQSVVLRSIESSDSMTDSSLEPEERTKQILREQYGMRTMEEQQLDAKQLARRKEEQKRWGDIKQKAGRNEDVDWFSIIPGPVLIAIDRFLKAGTAICGLVFVLSGLFITAEAWSKASGQALPPGLDAFIVETIEPNFTPGLLVLLLFSVSLGIFGAIQLGSQGATYKED